jgi:hypothetical protein
MVRAGVDDSAMAIGLGINVKLGITPSRRGTMPASRGGGSMLRIFAVQIHFTTSTKTKVNPNVSSIWSRCPRA